MAFTLDPLDLPAVGWRASLSAAQSAFQPQIGAFTVRCRSSGAWPSGCVPASSLSVFGDGDGSRRIFRCLPLLRVWPDCPDCRASHGLRSPCPVPRLAPWPARTVSSVGARVALTWLDVSAVPSPLNNAAAQHLCRSTSLPLEVQSAHSRSCRCLFFLCTAGAHRRLTTPRLPLLEFSKSPLRRLAHARPTPTFGVPRSPEPPLWLRSFGATRWSRSVLVVSHDLDGLLPCMRCRLIASCFQPWGLPGFGPACAELALPRARGFA